MNTGWPRLCAEPLFAADFGYFDTADGQLPAALPSATQQLHFTLVSPCVQKGLPVLLALAEALPDVQFAAVRAACKWPTDGGQCAGGHAVDGRTRPGSYGSSTQSGDMVCRPRCKCHIPED